MAVTVAFVAETAAGERRAAITPETCKKLLARGARVLLEPGAGAVAGFPDAQYADAAFAARAEVLAQADVLLCVQPPPAADIAAMHRGALLLGLLAPHADPGRIPSFAAAGLTAFSLARL